MSKSVIVFVSVLIAAYVFVISLYFLLNSKLVAHKRIDLINKPGECEIDISDRMFIQGRSKANINDFSYTALLEYQVDSDHIDCVGLLINHRYVITAATCLYERNIVNVRLRKYNTTKSLICDKDGECRPDSINVGVEKIIVHENYSRNGTFHDIGLVRLNMNIPFDDNYIRPICVPDSTMNTPVDQPVEVLSWASNAEMKQNPILQKFGIRIFEMEKCQQIYNDTRQILPSQFCAAGQDGKDLCILHSGDPLIMKYNNRTYIEGIASNYTCGKVDVPTVYTRVSYYREWILDNLQP